MRRLPGDLRRIELLDAAVAVLLDKGFARATTRDLAAALGIGRGLIHHYFASWPELRRAAFERLAARELEAADAALAGLPPARALARLLGWLAPDPGDPHWRLWNEAWAEAQRDAAFASLYVELVGRWRRALAETIRAGVARGGFACADPEDAAWRILALADGLGGYLLLPRAPLERGAALAHLATAAAREVGARPDELGAAA